MSIFQFSLSFFWGALLAIVLPKMVLDLVGMDLKDTRLGLLLGIGALVGGITQIGFGALSDVVGFRWGKRRPYLFVGTILTSLILLAFPYVQSYAALFGLIIIMQLFINSAIGPYQALMPDIIHPNYHGRGGAVMGMMTLIGRIGGAGGTASLLGRENGLLILFVLFIVLMNVCMLTTLYLVREPRFTGARKTVGETFAEIVDVPLKPYRSFTFLLGARFGMYLGFYSVMSFLLYYVKFTLGYPNEDEALIIIRNFFIISTLLGVVGMVPAGIYSDKLSKKSIMYVANSICFLSAIGFLLAGNATQAYFAVAIFGIGFGAFMTVDWALGCNLLPQHSKAKYFGVWNLSDILPQTLAPLVAGPVAAFVNSMYPPGGGYKAIMLLAITYFTIGTIILTQITERKIIKEPESEKVYKS